MRGTVVLATRDHARSIPAVLGELAAARNELTADGIDLDVVVVDSGSRDDTVDVARRAAKELGFAFRAVESVSAGAWATQRVAFAEALDEHRPDLIVTLDPAGHHDARQLPDLIRAFRARGSGLTIGSRWARGGSAPGTGRLRALLSRGASFLVARATGLRRVRDVTTSFRVIRPDAAALVAERPATVGDYGFYCEFVAVAQAYGFTVDEVPISFRPRFEEVAPLRLDDLVEFWGDLRRIRRRIGAIRREVAGDQATWAARSGRMREQSPDVGSEFGALDELAELSNAGRFTNWILDEFDAALHIGTGGHVVEVGAGLGAIALGLADRHPDVRVTALEPATNVFPELERRAADVSNLDVRQITSAELRPEPPGLDAAIYVNVLEHIERDTDELGTALRLLRPGGRLGVFVPAMPSLYGSLDYKSGHYRRYTAEQLRSRLVDAGFVDVDVRYLDVLGVAPYWLMYRFLDVDRLDRVSSTGYDRVVVPVSRSVQRVFPRPRFGKNLIATAVAPADVTT